MKPNPFIILILFACLTSCNHTEHQKQFPSSRDSMIIKKDSSVSEENDEPQIIEIDCDSIFKDKGIQIKLVAIDTSEVHQPYEFVFHFSSLKNGQSTEIFQDTIESVIQEVKFIDFNNDHIKDILIQNISDARSNWTYYLYLVDPTTYKLKKIKGFEEIPNPHYLPEYDLIDNYVMSGTDWISFYKIQGDSIKDFKVVIYDDHTATDNREYKKAIKKILKSEKR